MISIIIVNYESKKLLDKCLKSFLRYKPNVNFEILIINNSPLEKMKDIIKNLNLPISIIKSRKNLGFSRAVNKGVKKAKGEVILLLNPDVFFFNKSLEKLIKFANKNKDVGIIGGKIFKPGRKIVQKSITRKPNFKTAIFEFSNIKKLFPNNKFSKTFYFSGESKNITKNVTAVSGAFMLIKKTVFKKIGLFDENFFMYLEDVDFCLRADQAKFQIVYFPKSQIIHHEGGSSSNPYKINESAWNFSRKYFFKKHLGLFWGGIVLGALFSIDEKIVKIKHFLID